MNSVLNFFIDDFMNHLDDIRERQEEEKNKIADEWQESKNLPRKQKKAVRKHLLVRWAIADFDVFRA